MPPLMLATVMAILVARKLHPDSIYTEPLRRKGLRISQVATVSEAAAQQTVGDIMHQPVAPIRETADITQVADRFLTGANNFLPVVDGKNQLLGLVALHDLKQFLSGSEELRGVPRTKNSPMCWPW
jgi:CIC family chloride channel protein